MFGCVSHSGYMLRVARRGSTHRVSTVAPYTPVQVARRAPRVLSSRGRRYSLNDGVTRATDVIIVGKHASACGYGRDCTYSIRGSSARMLFAECFACRQVRSLECVAAHFV